jgi:Protein of unknown function (DUF2934)
MEYTSDRDGKSKTASGVDQSSYPEQNEVNNLALDDDSLPSRDQIAQRAFELWHAKGCPQGSAEQDWLDAEAELRAAGAPNGSTGTHAGSVQR